MQHQNVKGILVSTFQQHCHVNVKYIVTNFFHTVNASWRLKNQLQLKELSTYSNGKLPNTDTHFVQRINWYICIPSWFWDVWWPQRAMFIAAHNYRWFAISTEKIKHFSVLRDKSIKNAALLHVRYQPWAIYCQIWTTSSRRVAIDWTQRYGLEHC